MDSEKECKSWSHVRKLCFQSSCREADVQHLDEGPLLAWGAQGCLRDIKHGKLRCETKDSGIMRPRMEHPSQDKTHTTRHHGVYASCDAELLKRFSPWEPELACLSVRPLSWASVQRTAATYLCRYIYIHTHIMCVIYIYLFRCASGSRLSREFVYF